MKKDIVNQILIYQGKNGEIQIQMDQKSDTVWARQEQIAELFDIDRTVVNRHIRNIFNTDELGKHRKIPFLKRDSSESLFLWLFQ